VFATTTADRKGEVVTAVVKFTPNGKRTTFVPEVARGQPTGLAINRNGDLFVGVTSVDKFHPGDSIAKVSGNNRQRTVFAKELAAPSNLTCDNAGNLFVSQHQDTISKFTPDGKQSTLVTGIVTYDLACDSSGNLFVADFRGDAILKIDANGTKTTFATKVKPWCLAFNKKDDLFVLDDVVEGGANGILKFTPDGNRTLFAKNPVEQPK